MAEDRVPHASDSEVAWKAFAADEVAALPPLADGIIELPVREVVKAEAPPPRPSAGKSPLGDYVREIQLEYEEQAKKGKLF